MAIPFNLKRKEETPAHMQPAIRYFNSEPVVDSRFT